MNEDTAKARYEALRPRRHAFLSRARDAAALTLPAVLPPEGHTATASLPQPYSGLGARCVLNLASRLLSALLPPGGSIFRLQVPPEVLAEAGAETEPPDMTRQIALTEKLIHGEIERRGWRQPTHLALQHLIVTGNALEQQMPDNALRVFRLDQYVVVRDPTGVPVEIVIEENFSPASLPAALKPLIEGRDDVTNSVSIYTWMRRDGPVWTARQEILDHIIPGSDGKFLHQALPFRALRWSPVLGEDYGRGKVEEHEADFRALDGLAKAVLDGAAMASRNITMIRPNAAGGLNLRKRFTEAKNGGTVIGNPEDITMLQFANAGGVQFAAQEMAIIKQDLAAAFLLGSGLRRDAERVTAFELRQVVEELEGALGGVYSTISQEMMRPRLDRLILQMQSNTQLPMWPEGSLEPVVLTGLSALGREQDVNRVGAAVSLLNGLPPEIVQDYPKWDAILTKAFNGLGMSDAVNSAADVQRMQAQRQQAAMAQQIAPIAAQAAADQAAPQQ